MGVYIKCMEMPDNCGKCKIRYEMFCPLLRRFIADEGRRHNCPLVEVPEHHGDLIDRMELLQTVKGNWKASSVNVFNLMLYVCNNFLDFIIKAQTVIPESEEGET